MLRGFQDIVSSISIRCVSNSLSLIRSGLTGRGGFHHEWQPAAPEKEQEEVEAAVVPPQRQGALHLHSP